VAEAVIFNVVPDTAPVSTCVPSPIILVIVHAPSVDINTSHTSAFVGVPAVPPPTISAYLIC